MTEPFYHKIEFEKIMHRVYMVVLYGGMVLALILAFRICQNLYLDQKWNEGYAREGQIMTTEEDFNKSLEYLENNDGQE